MIKLIVPRLEDLWFREEFMSDEATMSYNKKRGGTIAFPKANWEEWYDFWVTNPENERFYRYLSDEKDVFVGEIAYHFDWDEKKYIANVIVMAQYRGKGYGSSISLRQSDYIKMAFFLEVG